MQPLYDKILVSAPHLHEDKVQVGGLTLVKDTSFDEEKYRTARVEVLATPLALSSNNHLPQSKGGRKYSFDTIRDCPAAGDTAYVKWLALEENQRPDPDNHPHVYAVGLENVVALPDGCGGFLGFAGYVLCEPIFPSTTKEAAATGTMTASGLLLVSNIKQDYTEGDESNIKAEIPTKDGVAAIPGEGMVRYTGLPLRGQADEVKPFDVVVFDKAVCGRNGYPLRLKLEGREYYAVRRDSIVAVRESRRGLNERHLVLEPVTQAA